MTAAIHPVPSTSALWASMMHTALSRMTLPPVDRRNLPLSTRERIRRLKPGQSFFARWPTTVSRTTFLQRHYDAASIIGMQTGTQIMVRRSPTGVRVMCLGGDVARPNHGRPPLEHSAAVLALPVGGTYLWPLDGERGAKQIGTNLSRLGLNHGKKFSTRTVKADGVLMVGRVK